MTYRRISIITSIAVLLLLCASIPSFAWKFVSIADSRGSGTAINSTVLNKIVSRINSEGVDLVLFQGDAIETAPNDSTYSSWFDTWKSVMSKLNCPWYFTPGNHDIVRSTSHGILRGKLSMPLNGPAGYEETVYSFDHNNAHFVALNSNHWGQAHHVQRTWLAADLAKTTQPHVFVMAHEPAYPVGSHRGSSLDVYASERDDFWNKMTAGRVSMYFCGHEHLYHRAKRGSIYQVINGSCGAPLYSASGAISKYHYVVVDINGYNVNCQAKDADGNVIDSWSYTVPSTTVPQISLSLAVDKTTALSGEVITYTLTYTNKGSASAVNEKIKLPIPANTTFVTGSAGTGVYDSTNRLVTWTISSVAPGASGTCVMKVKIN